METNLLYSQVETMNCEETQNTSEVNPVYNNSVNTVEENWLSILPEELLSCIIILLEAKDLLTVARVSKEWYARASNSFYWKRLVAEKWGWNVNPSLLSGEEDWKKVYRELTTDLPRELSTSLNYREGIKISEDRLSASFLGRIGGDQVVVGNKPFLLPFKNEPSRKVVTLEPYFDEEGKILYKVSRRNIVYYEITIKASQDENKKEDPYHSYRQPCIAIGLGDSLFPITGAQPGWKRGSYGYHSDDGKKFSGNSVTASPYGPMFKAGDTVGCGLNLKKKQIFFTYNGEPLKEVAFTNLEDTSLFPIVGLDSNDIVEFNFGQKPWVYKFDKKPEQPTLRSPMSIRDIIRSRLSFFGFTMDTGEDSSDESDAPAAEDDNDDEDVHVELEFESDAEDDDMDDDLEHDNDEADEDEEEYHSAEDAEMADVTEQNGGLPANEDDIFG